MSTKRNKVESENEDDPEPFESSGDEWDAQVQEAKNGRRKSARVVKKPKRVTEESGSDDKGEFSDEDFVEEPKSKKPGPKGPKGAKAAAKKPQVKVSEEGEEDSSDGEFVEDEKLKKKKPAPKKAAPKPNPKNKKPANESEEGTSEEADSNSDNDDSSSSSKSKTRQPLPKTIYSEDFATGSFVILKKDAKGGKDKHPVIWRIDGKALLQKFEAFDEDDKIRHKNTSIYTGWSPLDQEMYGPLTVDVITHYKSSLVVEVHWNELSAINTDSD